MFAEALTPNEIAGTSFRRMSRMVMHHLNNGLVVRKHKKSDCKESTLLRFDKMKCFIAQFRLIRIAV